MAALKPGPSRSDGSTVTSSGLVPSTAGSPTGLEPYLRALVELFGSDLHCKVGSPPRVRIDGRLRRLEAPALTAEDT